MKKQKSDKVAEKIPKPKPEEIENLRQQLEISQTGKNGLFEKLQRISADYANYQKRVARQISDSVVYEKEKIIKSLLPILDNFERMLQNVQSVESMEVVVKGVRIVYDQMLDILKLYGVEQIKSLGEKFDPLLHQAILQKQEQDKEDGIIIEEFQKGYKLNGRVIRPGKVIVNKLVSEKKEQQQMEKPEGEIVKENDPGQESTKEM